MKRSKHSLSHYKLLSCNMGELIPTSCIEVLPGDTIQQTSRALVRVTPLLAPMMHPVHIRVHHWYVPTRLIWDGFEDFITGGPDGDNSDESPYKRWTSPYVEQGTLADYFGIPINTPLGSGGTYMEASALPFRAYNLIWNEWYRDQDLQTPLVIDKNQGLDSLTPTTLQAPAWEKDYFTTARPWPQKGPDITIPVALQGQAPVSGIGTGSAANSTAGPLAAKTPIGGDSFANYYGGAGSTLYLDATGTPNASPAVYAELGQALAQGNITIEDLRRSLALQHFEEARGMYGSRYTEYLRYYGVRSSDARLQRPEYLGGGRQTLQISEVLQTAPTEDGDDTVGVGNLKGHGIAALRTNRYRRFFEEHGYVISLMSVMPRTMYTQGLPRMWTRRTKEDYYMKELEKIGQQELLNKEIYAAGANPQGVFGYQDRYDEYRRTENTVSGEFRTSTLNFWHMAREFSGAPALNAAFVKANPTTRPYAVKTNDQLWIMMQHGIVARRLVTANTKPGLNYV